MTTDVENIIKEKEFFELTDQELAAVKEFAATQEEYEDLKWFLSSTGEAFEADKIEASPDLKKRVMKNLTEEKKRRGAWMNSVTIFLFPEGKAFYQMPATQLSVAAALLIGLFVFMGNPFKSAMDDEMAVNQDADKVGEVDSPDTGENLTAEKDAFLNEQEPSDDAISPEEEEADMDGVLLDAEGQKGEVTLEEAPMVMDMVEEVSDEVSDLSSADDFNKGASADRNMLNTKTSSGSGVANNVPASASDQKNVSLGGAAKLAKESGNREQNTNENNVGGVAESESLAFADEDAETEREDDARKKSTVYKRTESEVTTVSRDKSKDNNKADVKSEAPAYDFTVAQEEKSKERIEKKKLNVNDTKELKALFFTVK